MIISDLYVIHHHCFGTDDLVPTRSYVRATSKEEALNIYHKIAKERKEYPYCWDQKVSLEWVFQVETIN